MAITGVLNDLTEDNGGVFEYTRARILVYKRDSKKVIEFDSDLKTTGLFGIYFRRLKSIIILLLYLFRLHALGRYLFKLNVDRFDRIHIPYTTLTPIFFYKIPIIYTLHDLQDLIFPDYFTLKERLYRRIVTRICVKRAFLIECEAEHVKKDIAKFYNIDLDRIHVKPIPPISYFSNKNNSKLSVRLNRDHTFIYPAKRWPHKNHQILFEGWKKYLQEGGQGTLLLTGTTIEAFKDIEIPKQVDFLGRISREDLDKAISHSLALIIPSFYESISIPVLEAQMAGTLVIASDIEGIRDQLGRDRRILFNPYDRVDIFEKLKYTESLECSDYESLVAFQWDCFRRFFGEI